MAFLVSILAEIPFINTSFYVGPIAKVFEGADIAWIIGLVVPAVLYYFPMRKKLNIAENAIKQENESIEKTDTSVK
ncbi:hypothetical protein SRABI133_05199 [Peribacillus simplex]|uniref:Uncharacterized protein n=1 Tax=Peribacillus simplex TaxID=1478 RepID=A0A9W4L5F4_9BACI|nr:hypothetical protein SRABI133_05199 [Peribacillus simplex]